MKTTFILNTEALFKSTKLDTKANKSSLDALTDMASKGSTSKLQTLFDFTCKTLRGESVPLGNFRGRVVLVENVASM